MKKYISKKIIIFISFAVILFFCDFFSKHYLFLDEKNSNYMNVQHNFTIFGIRSLAHYNTTFFSFLNIDMPTWLIILIASVLTLSMIVWFSVTKSMFRMISISVLISGIIGNMFDNIAFGFVKDIIFVPWWDRGTFNLADVFVIVGAGLLFLSLLKDLIKMK